MSSLQTFTTSQLFYECRRRVQELWELRHEERNHWYELACRINVRRSENTRTEKHQNHELKRMLRYYPTDYLWREMKRRLDFLFRKEVYQPHVLAYLYKKCERFIKDLPPMTRHHEIETIAFHLTGHDAPIPITISRLFSVNLSIKETAFYERHRENLKRAFYDELLTPKEIDKARKRIATRIWRIMNQKRKAK